MNTSINFAAVQERCAELEGQLQWITAKHEALTNEHKSLVELCFKLIKACRIAIRTIDSLNTSGDAFKPFQRTHQLLSLALEEVNRRWP